MEPAIGGGAAVAATAATPLTDNEIVSRLDGLHCVWHDERKTQLDGTDETEVEGVIALLHAIGADSCRLAMPGITYTIQRSSCAARTLVITSVRQWGWHWHRDRGRWRRLFTRPTPEAVGGNRMGMGMGKNPRWRKNPTKQATAVEHEPGSTSSSSQGASTSAEAAKEMRIAKNTIGEAFRRSQIDLHGVLGSRLPREA
jgi:hypothetical protein